VFIWLLPFWRARRTARGLYFDEEEDGDDGDEIEIVDVDGMDGGSSADERGGKPGAATYREGVHHEQMA
jgi:hypothetical protein